MSRLLQRWLHAREGAVSFWDFFAVYPWRTLALAMILCWTAAALTEVLKK